jgi:ribosome-associated protein
VKRGPRARGPEDRAIESIDKALLAARTAQEKKGQNVTVLDVTGRCSYADALVIVSATSERQANAIADGIAEVVKKAGGGRAQIGDGTGGWALLDFGDLVVHVFTEEARGFYDLDKLWSDARRVAVPAVAPLVTAASGPSALAQRKQRTR